MRCRELPLSQRRSTIFVGTTGSGRGYVLLPIPARYQTIMGICMEIVITIKGNCVVKKNSMKHATHRYNKDGQAIPLKAPVTYYTDAYKEWETQAVQACTVFRSKLENEGVPFPLREKYNMKCLFFFDTMKDVDLSALYEAPQDVMAGKAPCMKNRIKGADFDIIRSRFQIIQDDSVRFIGSHDGSRWLYDPSNPRTIITLTPFIM
jgi:hypothetical protein